MGAAAPKRLRHFLQPDADLQVALHFTRDSQRNRTVVNDGSRAIWVLTLTDWLWPVAGIQAMRPSGR